MIVPVIAPIVAAVDVGTTGAFAVFATGVPKQIGVYDLPIIGKELDAGAFAKLLRDIAPDIVVVERQHPMPAQGVTSSFTLGNLYGAVKGVITATGIPMRIVSAREWKRHFRLDNDKEKSRRLASELWPSCRHFARKKDHNRSEACLLARFAADVLLRGAP